MTLSIGCVACLHGDVENAETFASRFEQRGVDAVVLVGDIAADEDQEHNLARILNIFAGLDAQLFVVPASHEQLPAYTTVMQQFSEEEDVVNCQNLTEYTLNGQHLIFLPGSASLAAGASFRLLRDRRSTGKDERVVAAHPEHFWNPVERSYAVDLRGVAGENSVLFTHDPPRCYTENGIDQAVFGQPTKPFYLPENGESLHATVRGHELTPNAILTEEDAAQLLEEGYPVEIREAHVGEPFLRGLVESLEVKRYVCGHIHESGGTAVTLHEQEVEERRWSTELFYNCSAGKDGRAGIVKLRGNEAWYENVLV